MIITIDGPAGSGKSYVARELAKRLGIYYLHTGLLYRAVAYIWTQILGNSLARGSEQLNNITPKDLQFISNISYEYRGEKPHIFYDGKDLTASLFEAAIDKPASILSAVPEVRAELLQLQQELSEKYDLVAEGRDCGSIVFPQADYKFFLTADVQTRVERIMADEKRGDIQENFEKVKAGLEARDERDKNRKISPLTVPDDAIIIDNSNMDKEDTIKRFLQYIEK